MFMKPKWVSQKWIETEHEKVPSWINKSDGIVGLQMALLKRLTPSAKRLHIVMLKQVCSLYRLRRVEKVHSGIPTTPYLKEFWAGTLVKD